MRMAESILAEETFGPEENSDDSFVASSCAYGCEDDWDWTTQSSGASYLTRNFRRRHLAAEQD